jgi:hypothetical protein
MGTNERHAKPGSGFKDTQSRVAEVQYGPLRNATVNLTLVSPAWIRLLMPSFRPEIDKMSIQQEALFLVLVRF